MNVTLASIVLAAALGMSGPAQAEVRELQLPSGRRVTVTQEYSGADHPWLVYLPGSPCALFNAEQDFVLNTLRSRRSYNLLVINKAGLLPGGACERPVFLEGSLRDSRIEDVLSVMDMVVPRAARVLLVGESEGAYIAPDIALARPQVSRLLLLSGGTRSWIEEEIMMAPIAERARLRDFFENEVLARPGYDEFYSDVTFAQLASYHTRRTFWSLARLNRPVLAINGTQDDLVWIEGVKRDYRHLPHELVLLEGAGHEVPGPEAHNRARVCEKLLAFSSGE